MQLVLMWLKTTPLLGMHVVVYFRWSKCISRQSTLTWKTSCRQRLTTLPTHRPDVRYSRWQSSSTTPLTRPNRGHYTASNRDVFLLLSESLCMLCLVWLFSAFFVIIYCGCCCRLWTVFNRHVFHRSLEVTPCPQLRKRTFGCANLTIPVAHSTVSKHWRNSFCHSL